MQVVDNSATAQIEEVLAHSSITGASSLPLTDVSQGLLDSHSFAQLSTSLHRLLALASLDEQSLIRMETHTPASASGGALLFEGTLSASVFGKVDHPTGYKRHFLCSRAANHLSFPIQGKGLLGKAFALTHRPGFAVHLQIVATLPHQMTA